MPHDKEAEPAPATGMYWSRAAVWGTLPSRTLRSPSITLIDNLAWVLGGSDDRDAVGTRDVLTFDTDTMQWARPETIGDSPPPCRAHTATLIDKKIILYGGGIGGLYYGHLYIFDTVARKWSQPPVHDGPKPIPRRAHTAVHYRNKIWIFGGGNGLMALSDLWTLDLGPNLTGVVDSVTGKRAARWTEIEVHGTKPGPRGYHSATLVKDTMVVVGGSDSKECYTDIWCLNLGAS
jgi:Rab9 effector protein with kelch motifs